MEAHRFYQQVHIEFTEGEDKITLEGPTKDVQIVQGQIEAIVTDLVRLLTSLFHDKRFHLLYILAYIGLNVS